MMMCGCRLRTNGGGGFTPPPARSARVISASHAAYYYYYHLLPFLRLWTQAPNRAGLPVSPVYGLLLGFYGRSIISPFYYAMRIRCPKTEKTQSGS